MEASGGNAKSPTWKELDRREAGGFGVTLLWDKTGNGLKVVVDDYRQGESFEVPASAENATDIFAHPYAYRPES